MRTRPRRQARQAQALVEFALVFPFVVLTFFAIFDVARLMFTQISLDAAAVVAARRLAMNDPGTTRGAVYLAATGAAPGVRLPPQAIEWSLVPGPDGRSWVEVRIASEETVLSAFYMTSGYRVGLTARAREPLAGLASGAAARLP